MSKAGFIALLGLITIFMPFLGIPNDVKVTLTVGGGALILILGFLVREERRWFLRALKGDHQTDAYTENGAHGYAQQVSERNG